MAQIINHAASSPAACISSNLLSGGIGGGEESIHAQLLVAAIPVASAARSHWSKVQVIRTILRFCLTTGLIFPSYIPLSDQVNPYNDGDRADAEADEGAHRSPDNDVIVNIPEEEEEESVNPTLADTGATGVLSATSDSPNNRASCCSAYDVHHVTVTVSEEESVHPSNASDRSLVKSIMRDEDLNTLRDRGSDQFIASVFNSSLESGLRSADLQQVNVSNGSAKPLTSYLIDETITCVIGLLIIIGSLSMVTGLIDYGRTTGWYDSFFIFVFTLLLILVPSVTKFREAKKQLRLEKKKVPVIRDGFRQEIAACAVVEGDLVILERGIRVPGDGLLIHGSDHDGRLDFDDRPNNPFLRHGSKVVCGTGRMMVTSVGCDTKMGELLRNAAPTNHRLLSWVLVPMSRLDILSLCSSILVLVGIFFLFRHKNHDKSLPEMKGKTPVENLMSIFMKSFLKPRGLVSVLATAISILPMAFQQGVPLAITSALTYWNQRVLNDDHHLAHPQNLSACATMGFATVICLDISVEILLQLMELGTFIVGDKEFTLGEESNEDVGRLLQRIGVSIDKCRDSRSPLDCLIEPLLQPPRMGVNEEEIMANMPFANKIRKSNSGKEVLLVNHGQDILHWRGPAERILERSSHYYDPELGDGVHMSDNQRKQFSERIAQMARDGVYPVALAYKKTADQELSQSNLILFAILRVKFQKEAISTIENFRKEGVSIKIFSEDRLDEVRPLLDPYLILCSNFGILEDTVRNERMKKSFALGMLDMVKLLKQEGNVVVLYVTGGQRSGDAPALREADVGLVSEDCSSEFTKEASDIVLSRRGKGLSSIYSLWNCCRPISNNLQKFTALQFIVCVSGLIINSVSGLVLGESAMTTIEVIWANLVICILGGLMMGIELPNCEMKAASNRLLGSRTNPLTKGMWTNFVIQVLYQVSVMMFILFEHHITGTKLGINQEVKNTFVFNSFILCQVVNVLNTMQLEKKQVFLETMKSYTFLASLVVILVVQILLVQFTGLLVNFPKLNFVQWVECFAVALLPWVCRLILERRVRRIILESLSNLAALFFTSIHIYSFQLSYIVIFMFIFLGYSWNMLS